MPTERGREALLAYRWSGARGSAPSPRAALTLVALPPARPQFVVSASKPASSYVLPTDQLAIATMVLLLLISAESVAVHSLATWRASTQAAAARRAARDRCLARMAAEAAAAAADAGASSRGSGQDPTLPSKMPPSPASTAGLGSHAASSAAAIAAAEAAVAAADCGATCHDSAQPATPLAGGPSGCGSGRRRLRRLESLSVDAAYDDWVAFQVDRAAAAALLLCYVLAVVLIFALQSGYVRIFP